MVNLATILQLTRPLAVMDTETTGVDPENDRIIQIGITMHYPHRDPIEWCQLVNPKCPIPIESTENSHGIRDDDVKDMPTFQEMALPLANKLINVDFCGYFIHFDLKVLRAEMRRSRVDWDWEKNGSFVIDPLQIFRKHFPHTLEAAYKQYVNPEGFKGAHHAGRDVAATEEVMFGQLEQYPSIPRTVEELSRFCFPVKPGALDPGGKLIWKNGEACISFGKWRGTPLKQVSRDYLKWMLGADFSAALKKIIEEALDGKYPVKK